MNAQHIEALKVIREDIADANATSRLAALLRSPEQLAQSHIFRAYCSLPFGPENDWNGEYSTSLALKRQWEFTVLAPAQHSLR